MKNGTRRNGRWLAVAAGSALAASGIAWAEPAKIAPDLEASRTRSDAQRVIVTTVS